MRALRARRRAGDREAGWALAHYGLDLYDFARLTGHGPSRALLSQVVGLKRSVGRGPAASLAVLTRLRAWVARLAGPRSPGAPGVPAGGGGGPREAAWRQLAQILDSDMAFLRRRTTLAQRVEVLRKLRQGPLRYAVLLRLYAPCAQAFRAAAEAPPEHRARILNYCLVPLYTVDPRPHLSRVRAVPDPPWTAYRRGLEALLDRVEAAGGRAAVIASHRRAEDRRFFREEGHRLPLPFGTWTALLPRLSGGRPVGAGAELAWLRDRLLAGGQVVVAPQPRHVRVALSRLFFAYGKSTHLTLYAPHNLPMRALDGVLERAVDVGYYTLGLGGVRASARRAGYWRLTAAPPLERREVVLSLAPASPAARMLKGLSPRVLRWSWRCAKQGLGLRVGRAAVRPVGRDGALPPVPVAGTLAQTVLAALGALRAAFPEECAVFLYPEDGVTVGEVVAVLEAWERAPRRVLGAVRYVGLQRTAPKPSAATGAFAVRAAARRRARVRLWGLARVGPELRLSLRGALRRCYRTALDSLPTRWAEIRVVPAGDRLLLSQLRGTAPESVALNTCLERAIRQWMRQARVSVDRLPRFRVRLDLAPEGGPRPGGPRR